MSIERLEELARKATPGPWTDERPPKDADGWLRGSIICGTPGRQGVWTRHEGGTYPRSDQRYIAAVDPQTVLAMIAVCMAADKVTHADWMGAPDDERRARMSVLHEAIGVLKMHMEAKP